MSAEAEEKTEALLEDDDAAIDEGQGGDLVVDDEEPHETALEAYKRKRRRNRILAAVVGAVIVVALAAVGVLVWIGALAPGNAAAKYAGLHYIYEEDVTDYIDTYKTQMGYGDADDETWASFLASYDLTPTRLRLTTMEQLIIDSMVQLKCADLGIEATDEEIQASVDAMKESYALGSDDIWQQTLEARGQTEDGLREVFRQTLLQQKLCQQVVETPEASDDEIRATIYNTGTSSGVEKTKHTFCFKMSGLDEGKSTEKLDEVTKLRNELIATGLTEENFGAYVQLFCDDDELVENNGANGWDLDTSEYSTEYIEQLNKLGEGEISPVFAEDDGYAFIWVSDVYKLPTSEKKAKKIDLDELPESLLEYFRDSAEYSLWQQASQEYLQSLIDESQPVYYPMPSDVPYNVDMSLADTSDKEIDGTSTEDGKDDTGDSDE